MNPKTGDVLTSTFETDQEAADRLKEDKTVFARDLVRQVNRLSQSQQYWLHKLAMDSKVRQTIELDSTKLLEAFAGPSAAGLKFPKLKVKIGGSSLIIHKSLSVYYGQKYLGRWKETDKFEYMELDETVNYTKEILGALKLMCIDPAKTCRLYGIKTGICCCCGAELTNPESIMLGIGPICRDKWRF